MRGKDIQEVKNPKPLVFISHITEEAELAKILKTYLSRLAFLDEDKIFASFNINKGANWFQEIKNALQKVKVTLVLCSKASIERPWINLEVGASLVRDISVIPICHTDLEFSDLPFQFQTQNAAKIAENDLVEIVETIAQKCGKIPRIDYEELKKEIKRMGDFEQRNVPTEPRVTIIEGVLERTRQIVHDLDELGRSVSRPWEETIWFNGSLSAFAISDKEEKEKEYKEALLEERDRLLSLASQGLSIKCIITPPTPMLYPAQIIGNTLLLRLNHLLEFLQSDHDALKHIDWVVSPYRQKNCYIIGHISIIEGYRKGGVAQGYDHTLRQTDPDVMAVNVRLHEILFDELVAYTLANFPLTQEEIKTARNINEIMRKATTEAIKRSREYVNSLPIMKE